MGAVEKLSIALTGELGLEIEAAVASGDYSAASEVVRDARGRSGCRRSLGVDRGG